jgi:hypothetical protein
MTQADTSRPVIWVDGFEAIRHRTRNLRFEDITLPDGASIKVNRCEGISFRDVLSRKGVKPDFQVTNSQDVEY